MGQILSKNRCRRMRKKKIDSHRPTVGMRTIQLVEWWWRGDRECGQIKARGS
jgi:hypothetical protein